MEENTPDAAKKISCAGNFTRLYAATEHALNYYLMEYPISPECEKILSSQTPKENHRLLINFAQKINLNVGKKEYLLSQLSKINLDFYRKGGNPVLNVVVPLSVVSGAENLFSPFLEVAKNMPNLLEIFNTLSRKEGFRHGSEEENFSVDEYSKLENDIRKFINILLPDYRQSEEERNSESFKVSISQERLNATVELKKLIGSKIYYNAGENLKNYLIRLSPYYTGNKMLSPMDFINYLYICLEIYLRTGSQNLAVETKSIAAVISDIEKITGVPLPKTLSSVREIMFNAALNGRNASLGAYTLVFFGFLPKELLNDKALVKKCLIISAE